MKIIKSLLILFLFLPSCMSASEVLFMSKDNNVCRTLKGKVVLYAIFVDSQHTCPWTEYDINSTLDSISKSMQWVMASAKSNNIPLDIIIDYHKNPNGIIPISNNFQKKTLSATLNTQPLHSGIKSIYRWADKIAATAGKSYPADSSKGWIQVINATSWLNNNFSITNIGFP